MEPQTAPKQYSLLFTIQSVFLIICLALAFVLTGYSYVKNREIAIRSGREMLEQVSTSITVQWRRILERPARVALHMPDIPGITQQPVELKTHAIPLFIDVLHLRESIHALYIGWDDGGMLRVIRAKDMRDAFVGETIPDKGNYYAEFISEKNGQPSATYAFFDRIGTRIGELRHRPSSYDPRTRPWFKQGKDNPNQVEQVPPYKFVSPPVIGTTYTNTFEGHPGGVFGVDVRLDTLTSFLKEQTPGPDGRIVIFNDDGTVAIHNAMTGDDLIQDETTSTFAPVTIESIDDPVLSAVYQKYSDGRFTIGDPLSVTVDQEYIGSLSKGAILHDDRLIAVFAPQDYFTSGIKETATNVLIYSSIFVLVAVIAVISISRRISTPLKTLEQEAEKIRRFELDSSVQVRSRIKEVARLSAAIRSMREGIKTFTQYIPSDLVRRYVASGVTPEVGGEQRTLTILFTDVANFTTTSENMEPGTVMNMLSEYFSRMGKIVTDLDGTIDKYIGDALMAFWNAPAETPAHTPAACEAALRCAQSTSSFRFTHPNASIISLPTRFGLHRGEVVAGNMGSSDRLNYTILGSPVNMASRLEGLNKYYGTTILVSQTVRDNAGDQFIFRSVDRTLPKGALTPMTIYSLEGARPEGELPELAVESSRLLFLEQWERAFKLYQERKWQEALDLFTTMDDTDPVTALYLKRSREYVASPPDDSWDGVEVMTQK